MGCRKSGTDWPTISERGRAIRNSAGNWSKATAGNMLAQPGRSEGGSLMVRSMILSAAVIVGFASAASAQDLKAKGAEVYTAQKCSLCHSVAGKGNPKGALDDVGSKLKADEIRQWVTDSKGMTAKTQATRKPEMKAYSLPKDDVDALVAYLSSMKK
jgi:mono/diheme cytochrome c family protein